ncbi:hypothetical protein [Gaiella sp.]|jgi:hypothetical protein|uniref:hypothetical protein n=1 Tax=Gaiella sp. TaxID=2663207 RepID=UPI002E363A3D|nr:hypothetical protein [Gaiella sp.]HEX5584677.1 hypothetical protein [Gaiella sp.]
MTTLPSALVRFQDDLEAAIARQQRPRSYGRRRLALRVALATGAAAAVAAGALTALPSDPGGRLVETASAAQRAAAALAAPPGSIVHVDMAVTQRSPDGSQTSWRAESWQQTTPPYAMRQVVTDQSGKPVETSTPQPVVAQPFREQVLDLLRSGKLTESGRATVDGREAVSFTWDDGHTRYAYTVDAGTYTPVRWLIAPLGAESETIVTFETYETLPAGQMAPNLTDRTP